MRLSIIPLPGSRAEEKAINLKFLNRLFKLGLNIYGNNIAGLEKDLCRSQPNPLNVEAIQLCRPGEEGHYQDSIQDELRCYQKALEQSDIYLISKPPAKPHKYRGNGEYADLDEVFDVAKKANQTLLNSDRVLNQSVKDIAAKNTTLIDWVIAQYDKIRTPSINTDSPTTQTQPSSKPLHETDETKVSTPATQPQPRKGLLQRIGEKNVSKSTAVAVIATEIIMGLGLAGYVYSGSKVKPFDPTLTHEDVLRLHEGEKVALDYEGRRVYCGPLTMSEIRHRMQEINPCKEKLISTLEQLDIEIPQALRDADSNLSHLGYGINEKREPLLLSMYDTKDFRTGDFLLAGYFSAFDQVTYKDYQDYTKAHGKSGLTLPPEVFAENSSNSREPLHNFIKGLYPENATGAQKETKIFKVYNEFLETLKFKQQQALSL